ncbi:MAG: type II toxin-antitoxin system VapC family toxin [Candidatus Dormibacteria bacterium]
MDSSALVKLVFPEAESERLADWLTARPEAPKLTSQLSLIEVVLTCQRHDPALEPAARRLLAGLDLVPIGDAVLEGASQLRRPSLRSLCAIHLASALTLGVELEAFVAYDIRLLEAARAERLPIVSP